MLTKVASNSGQYGCEVGCAVPPKRWGVLWQQGCSLVVCILPDVTQLGMHLIAVGKSGLEEDNVF